MWLYAIGIVAILAIIGTALGSAWGPLLLGVGFAVWGTLFFMSGFVSPWPMIGILYIGGSLAEFAAVWVFLRTEARARPPLSWRAGAALLGVAGSVGFIVLLAIIAAAIAGFYSQL